MMEFRDVGRWLIILLAFLAMDLALAEIGLREPRQDDYDRAAMLAAFGTVLWAIRETRTPNTDGMGGPA